MNQSSSAPIPGSHESHIQINGPTIKQFINEIRQLPPDQKMAQIGIERNVLGLPNDDSKFDGKSFFADNAFSILKQAKAPKLWLDFLALQPLTDLIKKLPPETLFFIFYAQPHDKIQMSAANELKVRGWQYTPKGAIWSLQKRDTYLLFDVNGWVIKEIAMY